MTDQTDSQLLKTYVEARLESAFAELVRRHVDFVYSAAVRMIRDPHLAEDVTQGVFIALAKQAPGLVGRATLAGWLHCTARNIAAQTVRTIERRRAREQEAVAMNQLLAAETKTSWNDIAPHLDAALGELTDSDRDAVLLRYFEKKSALEIAALLGTSEEAAQKRVSRAVERLRGFFSKRGVTVSAGGLVVVISANAVQAAPAALLATISTAVLAGTAATTSTFVAATTKTIAMTTLQKTLVLATMAVLAGAGIYEGKQAHVARAQAQSLQQQQAPLTEQIQQLQNRVADATNRLADLLAENSSLKANPERSELLKLRGEVTRLRPVQEDVVALQKTLRQSATGVTEWQPKEMRYMGRATPQDALQTLFWSEMTTNISEMQNNYIADQADAPDDKAMEEYYTSAGSRETEGVSTIRVLSQSMKSSDEAMLEVQFRYDESNGQMNAGSGISGMIYLRKIGSEWKFVLANVRDKDGNIVGVDIAKGKR